jgi:hypothetical protein
VNLSTILHRQHSPGVGGARPGGARAPAVLAASESTRRRPDPEPGDEDEEDKYDTWDPLNLNPMTCGTHKWE